MNLRDNEICIECGVRARFKRDLLCEHCRSKAGFVETKEPCRCNCGYTCGRRCGLGIMECMEQHYRQDCDHKWDGKQHEFGSEGGCSGFSVTCSKCGMLAMDHDCAVGP